MSGSLSTAARDAILKELKGELPKAGDLGPIRTLLQSAQFEEVRLLSNYRTEWNKKFQAWLGHKSTLTQVELPKPTDYSEIFRIADAELAALRTRKNASDVDLCLHLSPGTPAMAAVWLLLGKTRYPATFYETYGGKSSVTEVPFDLTIDVLPELIRNPDVHLQHLASESPADVEGFQDIVGDSQAIRDAVGRARRAAMRGVSVLLLGESGTGKEMFAQAIHRASARRERPYLAINCAALSRTLLESELFGHVRGAFTGADKQRKGAFESAQGGTLFLDEIGECDLETQAKLLRALQPISGAGPCVRTIRRVGDERDLQVDVRVVAATNRDLQQEIRHGRFRDDLYYRLAGFTVIIPALRDRRADLAPLAQHLLAQINREFEAEEPGYAHKSLSASAIAFVKRYDWPGNVRQLRNALVQAAVLCEGTSIGKSDLVAALGELGSASAVHRIADRPLGDGFQLDEYLNDIHRQYLRRAMDEASGVKTQAARLLGIENYQTLDARLKRLNVQGDWTS